MIAAMKQAGVQVMRRTIKRYVIRFGVFLVIGIVGVGYRMVTGRSAEASVADREPAFPKSHAAAKTAVSVAAAPAPSAPTVAERVIAPQGIDINAPKRAAQKAVAAENAQLEAQTGQNVQQAGQPSAPISGPGSRPNGVPASPTASATPSSGAIDASGASRVGAPVTRESYAYEGDGRRDPFYSLILTDDLRPLLADLRLVGILYEASGRRTVAIMRDLQTNAQYRVANGSTLGRMRVAQIRPRAVIFTIDEFGLSRQDSLVWTDTTKVRN
jgi:hypothetical protein